MDKWRFAHLLKMLRLEDKIKSEEAFGELWKIRKGDLSKMKNHTGTSMPFDKKIAEKFPEYKSYIFRPESELRADAKKHLEKALQDVAHWGEYLLRT